MTDKPKGVADAARTSFEAEAAPEKRAKAGLRIKVRKVGNSLGIILPKEVLARLRVGAGDELTLSETPGGVALAALDPDVQEQVEIARRLMDRYRNALAELAK